MISYIKGKVIFSKTGFVIVKTGGVGYGINVGSLVVLKADSLVEFFIHQHFREDSADLYGFATYAELELFEKLISVNGVGPKVGLNIMSATDPGRIIAAIVSDDLGFFTAIPGIGKKVAAKIILELKTKLSGDQNINVLSAAGSDSDDLANTLTLLGYTKAEIFSVMAKIPVETKTLEDKVRWSLKHLAK